MCGEARELYGVAQEGRPHEILSKAKEATLSA